MQGSNLLQKAARGMASVAFSYQDVMEQPNKPHVEYRKVSSDHVQTIKVNGKEILQVRLGSCVPLQHYFLTFLQPNTRRTDSVHPGHVTSPPNTTGTAENSPPPNTQPKTLHKLDAVPALTHPQVAPEGLTLLAREAMVDIAHLLRTSHLQQLRNILDDKEASANDKFVALELLKNANIAAGVGDGRHHGVSLLMR